MKVLLSWLKEYLALSQSPAEIAKILTMLGLEVEAIEMMPLSFEKVVVGKVLTVEKHPNADSLSVVTVSDGNQTVQVVCGATNCRPGLKTAFAPIGAKLFEEPGKEFIIKKAKIRGIESFGMLCSGKELKLSDEDEGILEFNEEFREGTSLVDICSEAVFEVAITPNLGHCASILGIVRELSAAIRHPFHLPKIAFVEDPKHSIHDVAKVVVDDKVNCPRYACRVIQGLQVGPSPNWLQKRLEACGIRSINNVVDVTNYVLLEMGHPLHAFDYDLIEGHEIIVRKAKEGEKLITLDGKERHLNPENLVICDRTKPVAIAGIMGGNDTEVTAHTKNIILESACFHPKSIRRTSKKFGLQSEASRRFERGCDPNNVIAALERASMLIQKLAGGHVVSHMIDLKAHEFLEKKISCRVSRINQVIGIHISTSEIETVFHRLGFTYTLQDPHTFLVHIPTYRVDIQGEIDLVEEVARIYGYENIVKHPAFFQSSQLPHAPIFIFEREARLRLIAEGLQEFLTCDLIGPNLAAIVENGVIKPEAIIHVSNPTSIEQSILRPSLLPGLLQLVKNNYDLQNHDISGFEIGRIHFKQGDQYKEQSAVGIVLTGLTRPYHWGRKPGEVDFYLLKGMIENVLSGLGVKDILFKPSHLNTFHNGRQAGIFAGSLAIGSLGEVHPAIVRTLDIPQRIFYAEFNLHDLIQVRVPETKMVDLPLYPSSERDWTITLKKEAPIQEVFTAVRSIQSLMLEEVCLLDVYENERLGKERKNVTLHFVYRDLKKTLSQAEVDAEHARLTQATLHLLGKDVI